jgi:plasmid stabilization system protein ParE
MPRVTYLPEAEADLHGIWRDGYHESQSLQVADRLIAKIDAVAVTYATHPLLGELRPECAAFPLVITSSSMCPMTMASK